MITPEKPNRPEAATLGYIPEAPTEAVSTPSYPLIEDAQDATSPDAPSVVEAAPVEPIAPPVEAPTPAVQPAPAAAPINLAPPEEARDLEKWLYAQ